MLPTRLLDHRRTDDGVVLPVWLGGRDEPWLRELAAEAAASDGRRVDVAEERIQEIVAPLARRHGVSRRAVEAVWLVERRRWKTRIDAPTSPERIRRAVFGYAVERSREEALATAAHDLGVPIEAIEPSLFADRARARRLVAPSPSSSAADLADAYNLALVQSLLCRSTEIAAVARASARSVVRYAKLLGLMTLIDETEDRATRITVSGPLSLFHDTLKYGRALARWFPSVVSTPGWSIEAKVVLGGDALRLKLDAGAPLPRAYALPREHDSRLEARLERDLRRLCSSWRIERESTVVRAGRALFYPDFTLVSERGRVAVEVVGFWTPEYLARKASLLATCQVPLVVCADARHAREVVAADPRVVLFERRLDAAAVLAACERAVDASQVLPRASVGRVAVPPRHYVVLAPTSSVRHHAVAAGARPERWREDVVEDLGRDGALRTVLLPAHPRYGPQLGVVGSRFYAEANADARRDDVLFVHRVMPVAKRQPDAERAWSRGLVLVDQAAVPPERLETVSDLFR